MIDSGLVEALNHSIDRLNAGGTVADCLRAFPRYAAELAPLLEAGSLVYRATPDNQTAIDARERQRFRFEQALSQPMPRRRSTTPPVLLRWIASLVLILVMLTGGASLLAETSLPGDALYSLKRWTESARLILIPNDPSLQTEFAARRLDEARQLVRLRRGASLTFTGSVDAILADGLIISGLPVRADPNAVPLGSRVEVDVLSTEQGTLIARQIRILETRPLPAFTPTLTPTPSPTATPMRAITRPLTDTTRIVSTPIPAAPSRPAPTRSPVDDPPPPTVALSRPDGDGAAPPPTESRGRGG